MSTTYPDPRTVTAREVLAGLRGIVEREQLDHVGYVGQEVDWQLAASGALCRGHRACVVGATWLAGGIDPVRTRVGYYFEHWSYGLPGACADHGDRLAWLEDRGYDGLRVAYEALNEAAQAYMDEHGLTVDSTWAHAGPLEGLFESEDPAGYEGFLIEPRDMLVVIDRAEELVA